MKGTMKKLEARNSFGGEQHIWSHNSTTLNCETNIAVYLPPQAQKEACPVLYWLSGLTCTERNFIEKSGFQKYASEHGIIVVAPDTSPRGNDIADAECYDLGKGAGFYVNATQEPWLKHYNMYDYVVTELPNLIDNNFNTTGKKSICGHSMGGHGALVIALRNPEEYLSVSAFAPIVAPIRSPWGKRAFNAYLGENQETWKAYDATELLSQIDNFMPILIEQGTSDEFLPQLQPHLLQDVAHVKGIECTVNEREGYDHSYYFIASFIGEHIAYHANQLK